MGASNALGFVGLMKTNGAEVFGVQLTWFQDDEGTTKRRLIYSKENGG